MTATVISIIKPNGNITRKTKETNSRPKTHNRHHSPPSKTTTHQNRGMVLTTDSLPISSERNVDWSSNLNTAHIHVKVERWRPETSNVVIDPHNQDSVQQAWIESRRVEEERLRSHREIAGFQKALKTRLRMHSQRKKEALSDALDQVAVQSTQRHKRCSHLSNCNHHPRHHSPSRCASPSPSPINAAAMIPFPMPTTLSSESLNLSDLPNDRTYFVHQSDPYHHFHNTAQPELTAMPWDLKEEDKTGRLERELRLFYRQSHLEEIRRKQFGAVYQATRHKYCQQERHEAAEWREKARLSSRSVSPGDGNGSLRIKTSARPKSLTMLLNDTRIRSSNNMEYRVERYTTTSASQTDLFDLNESVSRQTAFDELD